MKEKGKGLFQSLRKNFGNIRRQIFCFCGDILDFIRGHRDALIPPRILMFEGTRGARRFKKDGEHIFDLLLRFANLKPDDSILEVGCGIGRKAIPVVRYLNQDGRYEGIDIVEAGIKWANENIAKNRSNVFFHLVDVYNGYYNPAGTHKASDFQFPFSAQSFDLVFLTSVFTHMLPQDMIHYFSQISRVLKIGGRCLITFFLLNTESGDQIRAGKSQLNFQHSGDSMYRTVDAHLPETTICYEESYVLNLFPKHGLHIKQPIYYGSWCRDYPCESFQDTLIATRYL